MRVINSRTHPCLNRVKNARTALKKASVELKKSSVIARSEGYTLKEVAEAAGVSDVTILNWEKEHKNA